MKKQYLFFAFSMILLSVFSACSSSDETSEEELILEIGQEYQSGIIFYLDSIEEHGLIAYPSDLEDAPWGCFTQPNPVPPTAPIAQNDCIGFGEQNTLAIINFCNEPNSAARFTYNLDVNGYDDWYLPSIEELILIYENKDLIGGFPDLNNNPNEEYIIYASSSEGTAKNDGNGGFYYLNYQVYDFSVTTVFPDDRRLFTGKDNAMKVRPIRSF